MDASETTQTVAEAPRLCDLSRGPSGSATGLKHAVIVILLNAKILT